MDYAQMAAAAAEFVKVMAPSRTSGSSISTGETKGKSKTTQQRAISAEAMNKIMSDILGSEQGLASLATGENVSGGFGSTMKTQLAQDFLVKTSGELAALSAPMVTEADMSQTNEAKQESSSKTKRTVICTELLEQGLFPAELYNHPIALEHFLNLDQETIEGYHAWAVPVVSWMKKSPLLSKILRPIVLARYLQIIYGQRSILGSATIYLGQPLCYLIGSFLRAFTEEPNHGNTH